MNVDRFEITQGSDGYQINYREQKQKGWFLLVPPPHPFHNIFRGKTFPTLEAAEQALKDKFDRKIVAVYEVKS